MFLRNSGKTYSRNEIIPQNKVLKIITMQTCNIVVEEFRVVSGY